ncbi:MAG: type I phosphomannose isomerase catalytic subunit [Chthoniobacterales bacterium]
MERIWGGRRLEMLYGKRLPAGSRIGESWEVVDRPDAQSVVRAGPWRGRTLHEIWREHRAEIFGNIPPAERFPLLIKIIDAEEKLSLQVHPPEAAAQELGGEAKTEFWYIAEAKWPAEIFVGLKKDRTRADIEEALARGDVEEQLHRVTVATGDAMFLPSGRMHAIGGGNVIIEIQQNSDTTYRVFDWNRVDEAGAPRQLHLEQALRSIDFQDHEPGLVRPDGESLVRHDLFEVEKWDLHSPREVSLPGTFAIVICLSGEIDCAGMKFRAGEVFLVPASLAERKLIPQRDETSLLRVTIPTNA